MRAVLIEWTCARPLRVVHAVRDAIRRHPWWTDSLLALVLTFIAFASGLTVRHGVRSISPLELVLLALTTVPIVWRRYRPLAVLSVVTAAETILLLTSNAVQVPFGVVVAIYTVASRCERPVAIAAAKWAAPPLTLGVLVYNKANPGRVIPNLAVLAIAWAIGDNLRTRRAYLSELEARAARLEREREEQTVRATLEERARIARELHDVIAHNVSVMVVQASAGEDIFDADPVRARDALAAVATTGREALSELRRLLGVIKPGDGADPSYSPQPGIARLHELVRQVRDTGLAVELSIEGSLQELPEAASLCVYRVVQEALTNTLKHAAASRAQVSLRYEPDALFVRVADDGRGVAAAPINGTGSGHGLIGMRERLALFSGELQAGPSQDGGYCVSARLPLPVEAG